MLKYTLTIVAAMCLLGTSAQADLTGTTLDLEITQSGFPGTMVGPTGGTHSWGYTETFTGSMAGNRSWDATSPTAHPVYDNAILFDFTDFDYAAFAVIAPSTTTLNITNIAEEVDGTFGVYLPSDLGQDISLAGSGGSGNSLTLLWDVDTVVDVEPDFPMVVVAWNSVPTPGSLALLSLAGLTARSRRRRQ